MISETQLLQFFSGETCFRVLNELLKKPDYTTSLSKRLDIESSRITHCLKKLESLNIVHGYREKKLKFYEIKNKQKISKLFEIVREINNERK